MERTVREAGVLTLSSAAGNRFHLWDGFAAEPPSDPAAEARRLCGEGASDGLLLVLPVEGAAADCQMILHNADGGRAETCGNGLRCVGKWMFERGLVKGMRLRVQTDVGVVVVEVVPTQDGRSVASARVEFALPREACAIELELPKTTRPAFTKPTRIEAIFVNVGNPHCVLFGERSLLARLPRLGAALEHHRQFPHRTNVELCRLDPERANRLVVRVWERGVGETPACGSGAVAVAFAAVEQGLTHWPVTIRMPGGDLTVDRTGNTLWLAGPVD